MENASKALIIAGAILLSILIIALGIYVFNMAKGATNTKALDDLEISEFNSQFTTFDGQNIGSNVTSLLDKFISNATSNKDSDDRLPDIVYWETRNNGGKVTAITGDPAIAALPASNPLYNKLKDIGFNLADTSYPGSVGFYIESHSGKNNITGFSNLRNKIAVRHYYQVSHTIDNTTGLVDCVIIKY